MIRSLPSEAKSKNRITIGKVGAAHGIKGEMRIIPLTDFTERFSTMKEVMVGNELLHIESCKYHKQYVLLITMGVFLLSGLMERFALDAAMNFALLSAFSALEQDGQIAKN